MTTAAGSATVPRFQLRLPGAWHRIPLQDAEGARTAVRHLARAQYGAGDAQVARRIDLERRLMAGLDAAIKGAGSDVFIALTIVPGVPLPITAFVAAPARTLTPAVGTRPEATMDVLAEGIALAAGVDPDTLHRFTAGPSQVARRTRRQTIHTGQTTPAATTGDTADVGTLLVDYWITVPRTKQFLLVQFSTPLTDIEPVLVNLFDLIITASYWQ